MEGLETVLVHRDDHVGPGLVHAQRLGDHEGTRCEHHVARHDSDVGIARSLERRVQARQSTATREDIAHKLDIELRELLVQKRQVVGLVGRDD